MSNPEPLNQNKNDLAELLWVYWRATNISQAKLAPLIKTGTTSLNRWIAGKAVPEEPFLYQLLNIFIEHGAVTSQKQAEELSQRT